MVVIEALYVATTEVMMYFLITYMLSQFFSFLGNCLLFYIFWGLIHRLLGRLTDSGKPYAAVTIVHWVLFSLTLLFSLAAWAVYVVYTVGSVTYSTFITAMDWINIGSAIHILYWILSLEILAWSIFVFVKAGSHRFVSKVRAQRILRMITLISVQMPVLALISATVGWFALNLAWMVVWIRYNLERRNTVPEWHNTAQAVVNFIFWVVTFVGILLCCSKWRRLGEDPEKSDAPIRYPYPQYASGQYPPAHHPPAGQYPPNGNYPSPGQYLPGQYQTPYPNQPNGTAPYHDYAANPATSPPPAQRAASPQ